MQDRAANKRTLAVILGRQGTRAEYLLLLIVAYLVPVWFLVSGRFSFWILLPLLSIPLAVPLLRAVRTVEGRPLNPVLAGTARLSLVFGLLFALGMVISSL